jgi:hypothetical protein
VLLAPFGFGDCPLAKADNPPKMKFVDLYGKLLEMTPVLDGSIYREIHEMLEEELVEEQYLAMMGLLVRIGIKKGEPFKPDGTSRERLVALEWRAPTR